MGSAPTTGWEDDATRAKKRLIVCCDGTWMNSAYGYVKPGLLNGRGGLQVPSNVTRISRCFKRRCADGTLQIINYESGVGSGSNVLDSITGGAFGVGLAERVREAYSYLCANYRDGDEIFLVGFSRGAFTARSVAGLLANLGLLTREGVEHFYPIFKDMQNWINDDYRDPFPDVPFSDKPTGPDAAAEYRARLERIKYTRVRQRNGHLITVKAVCVWDTVGSLGIPRITWLEKLGIYPDNDEYKWHDTALSDRVENAFQALALDETRAPFGPALWERPRKAKLKTDLRQIWVPGNHGNIGGGWDDQGIANSTLAWMMDQMASVGVEFEIQALERVIHQSAAFYSNAQRHGPGKGRRRRNKLRRWAVDPIYEHNWPVRPWALGAMQKVSSPLFKLSGEATRTPGMYKQVDPKTKLEVSRYLQDTNETVHSSVRARLACEGLGLNDEAVWTCPALAGWRLRRVTVMPDPPASDRSSSSHADSGSDDADLFAAAELEERWQWKYVGDDDDAPAAPSQKVMWEERLGPYERFLLDLSGGTPNVYEFAERRANRSSRRRSGVPGC
ncbi:hypothetical protein CDD83_2401 [Cordyceps sp. RAO-2017]|nr:hypothetical protein CDD83_2401 [Cordyceps sp. RAO-2017]